MTQGLNTTKPAGVETPMPDFLSQYAGAGNENVTRNDMAVPRILLLQALSPQLERGNPAEIEGARSGDMINSVTSELFQSLLVVNCYFVYEVAVFKKRSAGGGFRGVFPTLQEAERFIAAHPEKDDLEPTEQGVHYCLLLDPESRLPMGEAAIVFSSTKMKVSRKWNSFIGLRPNAPRFAQVWKLSTVPEKNAKGSFYNYAVGPSGFITEDIVDAAKRLYEAVSSGERTVERKQDNDAPSEGPSTQRGGEEF